MQRMRTKLKMLAGAALLAAAFTPAASADTLREALDQAYRSNPSLTGARAGLRALDEGVPQAKALGRPTFSVTTGLTQSFRGLGRSEEHTSELQSLMRISYAVFCLNKKTHTKNIGSKDKS